MKADPPQDNLQQDPAPVSSEEGREEEKNRWLFEKMPVPKALATMAVPTVISQLIVLIYNMADTFYIGRTNNPYMVAGAALILPIFNVCIAVANIAGTGGGTLIARLMGARNPRSARRIASFSIWFSAFMGLFFAVMTAVFMHPLLTFLGASSQTYQFARQYCTCVIVLGGTPTITAMTMGNLLRNVGCSKQAGFAISMGGIINIILDPIFMFVLLPPGRSCHCPDQHLHLHLFCDHHPEAAQSHPAFFPQGRASGLCSSGFLFRRRYPRRHGALPFRPGLHCP